MKETELNQNIDPLRQFGKGDLRYLEAGTPEETIENIYSYLNNEYKQLGLELTPEQMIDHVVERVGLTETEKSRVFPNHPDLPEKEKEIQIYKRFLSVACADSMYIPGTLKQISRIPAKKFGDKTIIDLLSDDQSLDEFTYSRYKFHGAEMTSG